MIRYLDSIDAFRLDLSESTRLVAAAILWYRLKNVMLSCRTLSWSRQCFPSDRVREARSHLRTAAKKLDDRQDAARQTDCLPVLVVGARQCLQHGQRDGGQGAADDAARRVGAVGHRHSAGRRVTVVAHKPADEKAQYCDAASFPYGVLWSNRDTTSVIKKNTPDMSHWAAKNRIALMRMLPTDSCRQVATDGAVDRGTKTRRVPRFNGGIAKAYGCGVGICKTMRSCTVGWQLLCVTNH